MIPIKISRFNPETDADAYLQEYVVLKEERDTVLQALLSIYEEIDSTLAFRFGCRFKSCGLCGIQINGKPRLACLTELKEGMVLEPLRHLPILRDLAIDREIFYKQLKSLRLYIPFEDFPAEPQTIFESKAHKILVRCSECLICLAQCPHYDYRDTSFGGPYVFVKLAALHHDPRDRVDRVSQAKTLGIERCHRCRRCRLYCPKGINISKYAIHPLLMG